MSHKTLSVAVLFCLLFIGISANGENVVRQRLNFDKGWRFSLNPKEKGIFKPGFDDSRWRTLDLPHDWSIEGNFDGSAPSGWSGGCLPGGTGWYRKRFNLRREDGCRYYLDFDGSYMNTTVWVNGRNLGTRPYGYSSFRHDITQFLKADGNNVVTVKVDNSDQPNSRWYSGCGIYRHVWLVSTMDVHIAHWGTFVTTEGNRLKVTTDVENGRDSHVSLKIVNTLFDAQGHKVASGSCSSTVSAGCRASGMTEMKVKSPELWSVERPYVYEVRTEVYADGELVDAVTTPAGFRTFCFDPEKGFSLNGKNMKINGVCLHHDQGCLGAALNEDAVHRQLRILKEMGANAVRCSHNPPAPELLEMCDTMGIIVMDESFDMWHRKKTTNDYARFFDEWAERDLTDMVLRDRNHPSVLVWSIGNEVLEQWPSASADELTLEQVNTLLNAGHEVSPAPENGKMSANSLLTKKLVDTIKRLDGTRPVTAGCNEPSPNNLLFRSGALDIIGYNYHHKWVKDVPVNFPGKPFLMTETVSALQTRGNYLMPSDSVLVVTPPPYRDPSYECSAYDNMHTSWSSTHEETWDVVKHNDFVCGQFIWTGFDYIGEPTPFHFPARSSCFGIVDLAGFPKDIYYMYKSEWTDTPVLHLFPHWNWLPGDTVDLWCYYNGADEVELYVNGKSEGLRRKEDSHQYHVMWRVTFEPGEVRVVARRNGRKIAEQTIRTAGQPHHLRLTSDRTAFGNNPKGANLAFVTVEVVDRLGNLCPHAGNEVFFEVEGGEIVGVDNGCASSMERFKASHRKAYKGKCLAVVKQGEDGTPVRLTARSYDMPDATMTIMPGEK